MDKESKPLRSIFLYYFGSVGICYSQNCLRTSSPVVHLQTKTINKPGDATSYARTWRCSMHLTTVHIPSGRGKGLILSN